METSALIMQQHLLQRVRPPRPHSAPSKPLSESDNESEASEAGETGESPLCANSMPQTPTRTHRTPKTPRTPRTPIEAATAAAANVTPTTKSSNSSNNGKNGKARNKHKVAKKQNAEPGRSEQGAAGKLASGVSSANMQQTPGVLIVDGASLSKSAQKDTAGDRVHAESPCAGESQAAAKSEPAPKENRQSKKTYISPGHGTPSQYASHTDMPVYQDGYYYNEPSRQEYPATYVQHPHAYVAPPQQGYQPAPYAPRFDQGRFEQHQQRWDHQRYEQRPGSYRGGYHQHSRFNHNNQYHHNPPSHHHHHHQGMVDFRRDDGSYHAGYGQYRHSGYTPPKSNFHWNPSRQVSADYDPVPSRSSPPDLPISPQAIATAAARFESAGPVVQDASPRMLAAEQLDTKSELAATPAKLDGKLETIVELNSAEQLDAKPELSSTAEKPTVSREKADAAEKAAAKESTVSHEKLDSAEKTAEELAVPELDDEDSEATIEMDFRRMGPTAESEASTEIIADEASNVSPEATTEAPVTACVAELAAAHNETEVVEASATSPGKDSSDQVIQHQDSLIVQFAAVDMADVLPLADHLLSMYIGKVYCDMEISLNSTHKNWLDGRFPAHRATVAQSIVLQSILDQREAIHGKVKLELIAGKRFKILRSFDCALQNLYGLPLLEYDDIAKHTRLALCPRGLSNSEIPAYLTAYVTAQELDFLIGYMAVGAFMAIDRIALTGFRLMQDYIRWNNLETAFHFGVYPEEFLIMYCDVDEPQTKKAGKGNKGKGRKKPVELPPIAQPLNRQVIDNFAPRIATLAAKWLVENMPIKFTFDRAAYTSKSLQDRIPHNLLTDKSSGSPAPTATELTELQEGRREQPNAAHRLISGILLALPYEQLHEIVDLLRREDMLEEKLVREVLQEREQRRIRVLREFVRQQPNNKVKDVPPSHEVLGYREFAVHFETRDKLDKQMQEAKHDFTLHREWVGYRTGGEVEPAVKKFRA